MRAGVRGEGPGDGGEDALDDLTEDAKDAAAMVGVTAAPPKWEPRRGTRRR